MKLFDECVVFGRELMKSQDIDPIYDMLVEAQLEDRQLMNWLFAYWCFYDSGTASWIADTEQLNYWPRFYLALDDNMRHGPERRHFRGDKAFRALEWYRAMTPEEHVYGTFSKATRSYSQAMKHVQRWPQFGPWISFKVVDMLERIFQWDFSPIAGAELPKVVFKDPRQGAALVYHGDWKHPITDSELARVFWEIEGTVQDLSPPGVHSRSPNNQEVETILCKFKAHYKGHYPVGHDIRALEKSLKAQPECGMANYLADCCHALEFWS